MAGTDDTPGIQPKCIFNMDCGSLSSKVIIFKEESLAKCREIEAIRSNMAWKYGEIKFPLTPNDDVGYHVECYRKYTAISKAKKTIALETISIADSQSSTPPNLELPEKRSARSSDGIRSLPRTGILEEKCFFCEKKDKKFNGKKVLLHLCLTKEFQDKVESDARALNDEAFLRKINGLDFIAKEVKYHQICRVKYGARAKVAVSKNSALSEPKPVTDWHETRDFHKKSFESTCLFIEEKILQEEEVHMLRDLYRQYVNWLKELGRNCSAGVAQALGEKYRIEHFEQKIVRHFGDKVKVHQFSNKSFGKIVFKSSMSVSNALEKNMDEHKNHGVQLRDAAAILRKEILEANHRPLPSNLTVKDILEGEVEVPILVKTFFQSLVVGPPQNTDDDGKSKSSVSKTRQRRIMSLAHDSIYAVTNARMKPSKHLQLGLAVKSLTGSRKLIEILNRFGHSINYHLVEELETELTFTASDISRLLPDGLHPLPNLHTGLAFDNYDRFVDTINGRDTLHDTVGIAYQDILLHHPSIAPAPIPVVDNNETGRALRRRRAFDGQSAEITPYHKKPRMVTEPLIDLDDSRRDIENNSLTFGKKLNFLWMISLALNIPDTPMWVGWNSRLIKDTHRQQKVCYMPQINQSPTSTAVVLETMKMAQKVAEECDQDYISVTYDLAIAKIALSLQATEKPKFNNLFIQLGAFHIELSFFKAIGKFIAESGGPYMLTETDILAQGSLRGFIEGKHYNRCRRIHPLFAAAMESLHFHEFLRTFDNASKEEIICDLAKIEVFQLQESVSMPSLLSEVFDEYDKYCQQTMEGQHGETAKFWMTYVKMVTLYHEVSRATRTGDYLSYISLLPEVVSLFFVFNHQNYARWLTRFHDNLVRMEETHPGIKKDFESGIISIRRTGKPFSRQPIDLTLEQTVNADAANSSTGIVNLNLISSRLKWARSGNMRATLLSALYDDLGLSRKEDISRETHPSRIKTDNKHFSKIVDYIKTCRDPFGDKGDAGLYNISTGKATSKETSQFLLNVFEIGAKKRDEFIQRCCDDPSSFEKPIPREKINTFASECVKVTRKRTNGKLEEVKMERDMMGRLLAIALEKQVDMQQVLSYPLTPIPLCLGHSDGSMNKTKKSVLFEILEDRINSVPPSVFDVYVVDGYFFLHVCFDLPLTFGKLSRQILQKLCNVRASRIDLVFDRIVTPSIKDVERDNRSLSERDIPFNISGPNQQRPSDFLKALRNDNFKRELVQFFIEYWQDDSLAQIIGNKKIYVTCDVNCYSFVANADKVIRTEETGLRSNHEEADTRMIAHVATITGPSTVVIRTSDSDVFAIALGNVSKLNPNIKLYMEVGLQSQNKLRYIDISSLSKKLGDEFAQSIPAFHAFTGCDYSPAFANKGKKRPISILEKNVAFQKAFATLGKGSSLPDEVLGEIETFVCSMYGKKKLYCVHDARLQMFLAISKPKGNKPMKGVKGIDGSGLPPCKAVLRQQILRVHSICSSWNNATELNPTQIIPVGNGWQIEDGHYAPIWFEGEMSPPTLEEMIVTETEVTINEEDDVDSNYDESSDESSGDESIDENE